MVEGFYAITFRGYSDWGTGMLVLFNGIVAGADIGGVTYDGFYTSNDEAIEIALTLTVPPGTHLVQGIPAQSHQYSFKLETKIDLRTWSLQQPILIQTAYGPVNVLFKKVRNFPHNTTYGK